MNVAKLYAFYEKNDIRMLDKHGKCVLLKIGCTTASTVQKRVGEQSKGTIVSNNIIVWGQDNDKIATWYDGHKDADKDFHNFIKIRKPGSYRPDVGKEVFEITALELEALYQEFVKINSLSQQACPVYKITLENSKSVIEKQFNESCAQVLQRHTLCNVSKNGKFEVSDFDNDSLFLASFSKHFISIINGLSQNPLSEPGLDVKLWNYVLEYKNKFIKEIKEQQDKFFGDMNYLEELYAKLHRKRTKTNLNEVLSWFKNIELKDGYFLDYIQDMGCQVFVRKKCVSKSAKNINRQEKNWTNYIEIKNIFGYIDLAVFRRFILNLFRDYMGGIYEIRENLFCNSSIKDWLEECQENDCECEKVRESLKDLDCCPYVKINKDGTKSVFLVHVSYPWNMTVYWQEYIITDAPLDMIEKEEIKEIYVSEQEIIYD